MKRHAGTLCAITRQSEIQILQCAYRIYHLTCERSSGTRGIQRATYSSPRRGGFSQSSSRCLTSAKDEARQRNLERDGTCNKYLWTGHDGLPRIAVSRIALHRWRIWRIIERISDMRGPGGPRSILGTSTNVCNTFYSLHERPSTLPWPFAS
jgi:hypothetical protein